MCLTGCKHIRTFSEVNFIEVRDSPHGIFGSCTRCPRGLSRWAELLGRYRRCRRRQLVSPGGYRPPDPPPCLISKGMGHQNVRSHTRMLGPSVFPDSNTEGLARGRVFRMLGPIPECLVLQYIQIQIPTEGLARKRAENCKIRNLDENIVNSETIMYNFRLSKNQNC